MREIINIIRVPANHAPSSIENVVTINLLVNKKKFGAVEMRTIHLDGTIEEKLQQYKQATGEDWNGFNEQVFTYYDNREPETLNLGQTTKELIINPETQEAQRQIDALTRLANRWLKENEKAKTSRVTQKEVETLNI